MPYRERQQAGEMWNPLEGDFLEGYLRNIRSNVGENESNVYVFEQLNGETVGVWGNAVLDNQLSTEDVGKRFKITYLGQEPSKKRAGKYYKNFKIEDWVEAANKELDEARDRTVPSPLDKGLPPVESL